MEQTPKNPVNRGKEIFNRLPVSLRILLGELPQWLPQLKGKDLRRPLVVALLAIQMTAYNLIIDSEAQNPSSPPAVTETYQLPWSTLVPTLTPTLEPTLISPLDPNIESILSGKEEDVSFDLSKLLTSEYPSAVDFFDLSLHLAVLEEELSFSLESIKKEDINRFFAEVTPKILEIYKERNLSFGIWVENSFKPEDRTDRMPDFTIKKPETMAGAAAQTNYRKGTISFNEILFNSEGKCGLETIMFLLAHELAHYSGTTDELYKRDDPTNESAAQLVALEGLAYGYFKYRQEDPQLASLMLVGFVRTLRVILENAALYHIVNGGENLDLFIDYLNKLPNEDEKKRRLESFFPQGDKNVRLGKDVAYYYGWLPLQIILGENHSPLLFGNPQRRIELTYTTKLIR